VKSCFSDEAEEEDADYDLRDTEDENEREDFYPQDNNEVNAHLKISH
jgi:hypothetical protein